MIGPQRPLIFVHFPKAAGTSLLQQFENGFGAALLKDYDHRPFGPHRDAVADGIDSGIAAVYGHFRPGRYDRIGNAIRGTILRHPVDNLISIYFFWRTLPRRNAPLHEKFLAEAPGIEAFAAYPGMQTLMSETYFGGYDMRRFGFIGFHETRQADLTALSELVGFDVRADVRVNETPRTDERLALEGDSRTMQRLRDILATDVSFYDELMRRHASRGARLIV